MKLQFKVRSEDLKLTKAPPEKVTRQFMLKSSEVLSGEVERETPVQYGKLRNSWKPKLSYGQNPRLTLTNSRNYAVYVEKGTGIFGPKRHRIFPSNAQAFRAKIGNEIVFFKHHKGRPAKHMAEKGLHKYTLKIPQIFHTAVKQVLKGGK